MGFDGETDPLLESMSISKTCAACMAVTCAFMLLRASNDGEQIRRLVWGLGRVERKCLFISGYQFTPRTQSKQFSYGPQQALEREADRLIFIQVHTCAFACPCPSSR